MAKSEVLGSHAHTNWNICSRLLPSSCVHDSAADQLDPESEFYEDFPAIVVRKADDALSPTLLCTLDLVVRVVPEGDSLKSWSAALHVLEGSGIDPHISTFFNVNYCTVKPRYFGVGYSKINPLEFMMLTRFFRNPAIFNSNLPDFWHFLGVSMSPGIYVCIIVYGCVYTRVGPAFWVQPYGATYRVAGPALGVFICHIHHIQPYTAYTGQWGQLWGSVYAKYTIYRIYRAVEPALGVCICHIQAYTAYTGQCSQLWGSVYAIYTIYSIYRAVGPALGVCICHIHHIQHIQGRGASSGGLYMPYTAYTGQWGQLWGSVYAKYTIYSIYSIYTAAGSVNLLCHIQHIQGSGASSGVCICHIPPYTVVRAWIRFVRFDWLPVPLIWRLAPFRTGATKFNSDFLKTLK